MPNSTTGRSFSFLPASTISELTSTLRTVIIIFNLVLAVFAWFLSMAIVRRQIAEDKIERLAYYDLLTGLANPKMLFDRFNITLAAARRDNIPVYVFFIELDGFKEVNDRYGHKTGDKLLLEVAKQLQDGVRDMDTVSRFGGDEFIIIIKSNDHVDNIELIAERIIKRMAKPFKVDHHICQIGESIGIARYSRDGDTTFALINKADSVMYEAKKLGKNQYWFFQ